tara:strand:+ start:95 stop:385 length:291 start_codon:yes stop_codon:yes gene_type:complete
MKKRKRKRKRLFTYQYLQILHMEKHISHHILEEKPIPSLALKINIKERDCVMLACIQTKIMVSFNFNAVYGKERSKLKMRYRYGAMETFHIRTYRP